LPELVVPISCAVKLLPEIVILLPTPTNTVCVLFAGIETELPYRLPVALG
jgi:hypothetical protein